MTTLPNSLKSDNLVYYTLVDNINYVLGYCIYRLIVSLKYTIMILMKCMLY